MKKILIFTALVLSFATVETFAADATGQTPAPAPAAPAVSASAQTPATPAKTEKHKHKKHKNRAKHHEPKKTDGTN